MGDAGLGHGLPDLMVGFPIKGNCYYEPLLKIPASPKTDAV